MEHGEEDGRLRTRERLVKDIWSVGARVIVAMGINMGHGTCPRASTWTLPPCCLSPRARSPPNRRQRPAKTPGVTPPTQYSPYTRCTATTSAPADRAGPSRTATRARRPAQQRARGIARLSHPQASTGPCLRRQRTTLSCPTSLQWWAAHGGQLPPHRPSARRPRRAAIRRLVVQPPISLTLPPALPLSGPATSLPPLTPPHHLQPQRNVAAALHIPAHVALRAARRIASLPLATTILRFHLLYAPLPLPHRHRRRCLFRRSSSTRRLRHRRGSRLRLTALSPLRHP